MQSGISNANGTSRRFGVRCSFELHSGRSGLFVSLGHATGALTLAAVFPQFMTKGSSSVAGGESCNKILSRDRFVAAHKRA